jgi:hypothetical protein
MIALALALALWTLAPAERPQAIPGPCILDWGHGEVFAPTLMPGCEEYWEPSPSPCHCVPGPSNFPKLGHELYFPIARTQE